ncbi:FT-interacting protein [Trifolium repens]|nr:FT-interacting protein [Trifolium repens]
MKSACDMNLQQVTFESDAQVVVEAMHTSHNSIFRNSRLYRMVVKSEDGRELRAFNFKEEDESSCRQPPEEIEWHRRKLVTKPRMSQHVNSTEKSHNLKWSHIKNNSNNQTEKHEKCCSSWVSPAQQ